MCLLGRDFHILIKNASFLSPIDVGSHNPPIWGQHSHWHLFPSPIDVGSHSRTLIILQKEEEVGNNNKGLRLESLLPRRNVEVLFH